MKICTNGIYRDATAEEFAQWEADARRARLEEARRPLSESEVLAMLIPQQINTLDVDEATASRMVEFYPKITMYAEGSLISAGTCINWNGSLKQAAVDLWNTTENNPVNAPTLWQDIAYKQGIRVIPATITAGEAFAKGELGWWHDEVYESLIDANVYTPEQHPAGWELVR